MGLTNLYIILHLFSVCLLLFSYINFSFYNSGHPEHRHVTKVWCCHGTLSRA
nr:MAG TPA: hypothetical protein [Caudoviricetes sp.]